MYTMWNFLIMKSPIVKTQLDLVPFPYIKSVFEVTDIFDMKYLKLLILMIRSM